MKNKTTIIFGVILIAFGAHILFAEYGLAYKIGISWPAILLIVGAAMLIAYFTSKPKHSYLTCGSFLVWIGIYFTLLIDVFDESVRFKEYWPGIVIAIGLANVTIGLIDSKSRTQFVTGLTTAGAGIGLLYFSLTGWHKITVHSIAIFFAIILVMAGISLIGTFFFGGKEEI